MKRFTSLVTVAALAGSLVAIGSAARADFTYNMVSISDLSVSYHPGDTVKFYVTVTTTNSAITTLTPNSAIAFDPAVIDASGITVAASPQTFSAASSTNPAKQYMVFNGPGAIVNKSMPVTKAGSPTLITAQWNASHVAQKDIGNSSVTLALPAGTYTVGTFSTPILGTAHSASAQISLPTAFGYTGSVLAIDSVSAKAGSASLSEALLFGNAALTYRLAPQATPEPGAAALLVAGGLSGAGMFMRRRRAAK